MLTLRLALHQVKTETFCSCALQAESIENAASHPRNHNVSSFSDRVESHSVQPYLATAFFTYLCFPRSCFIYHWHPSACPLSRSAVEIMHMGSSNTNFAEMGRFNFEVSNFWVFDLGPTLIFLSNFLELEIPNKSLCMLQWFSHRFSTCFSWIALPLSRRTHSLQS